MEFIKIHENWKESDFLKKTDGRCYSDEGFDATLFTPDQILKFIQLIEKQILDKDSIHGDLEKYLTPNKKGKLEFHEEVSEIKKLCAIAKEKGLFLKCLDR